MMQTLVGLALSTFMLRPVHLNYEQDGSVLTDLIFTDYDGLLADPDDDDFNADPDDDDDFNNELDAQQVAGFVESLGPVEHEERLALMKASHDIPTEPRGRHDFHALPDSTRDQRHASDTYPWPNYYHMSDTSETKLPAMRYTECNDPTAGQQCFHEPTPIMQIFNVKVQSCVTDVTGPVEVYGIVAVRDDEDYRRRNYLFNRSRENPLDISLTGGYLRLLSPRRGMSMQFNCLIEVDIRVKAAGDDGTDDQTLADGCMEFVESRVCLEELLGCDMTGPYGSVAFDYIIFRKGFEATIELNFLEVPDGGFNIQMCGYTTVQKNYYAFIDKNCECDSFINSTGRFPHYFVAAVQKDDYFLLDFAEGRSPLIFKPTIHGSEEKEYSFRNGALVSVKLSWSTAFYI
ncbi:unnamed protein product [Urochloa decumbens]|uniref:DUF6598 domain-containing protein n=1 Tax=Urochloa decumbens TaxID=240449 RepID=A0ABC9BUX2_9POAL